MLPSWCEPEIHVAAGYIFGLLAEGKRGHFGDLRDVVEGCHFFRVMDEAGRRRAFNLALIFLTRPENEEGEHVPGALLFTMQPKSGQLYLVLRSSATEDELALEERAHHVWWTLEGARHTLNLAEDLRPPKF